MTESQQQKLQISAMNELIKNSDIRLAFQRCLIVLREFLPVDYISLHLFDEGLGIIETLVDATVNVSPVINNISVLTPEARELAAQSIKYIDPGKPYEIIDRLGDSVMAEQLGVDLGTPDSASLVLDLCQDGRYLGSVAFTGAPGAIYTHEHGAFVTTLHDTMACVVSRFLSLRECNRLRDSLADRANFLQSELLRGVDDQIIGADFGLKDVVASCRQVAPTDTPVLLLGETGVGKEVLAGAIHRISSRRDGPFIKVNCGGIPATLIESALFGHVKGAFTGALSDKKGYFERAQGGTIFLDEIGELPMEAQTRFLHVLQDKSFERVGGGKLRKANIRVLAATHRNLEKLIQEGKFRRDLLFRLNIFPLTIPPLRQRKVDIPPLAAHFISKIAGDMGLPEVPFAAPGAVDRLLEYQWPGNVRELANVIEREIIIRRDGPLTFEGINPDAESPFLKHCRPDEMILENIIAKHIVHGLRMTGGKIEGKGGTAELLGINSRTLQSKMKKLNIPFGRMAGDIYSV
ncbi:Sigma-54 interaction domain-containing protein [Maridesulfovibrio ferrireducens]|uniref:Sigma-54 interaction domain-containing protein n=1 Tax=Maridesulfovibrio ferrireducens TaxID=246191 RepID=A0A1G9EX76_9BACT|nr:sigma 54-interacting transcriptional regulator [Maridesulfovibrio ferrireducens]SDK80711.1 Sigma-54 interaction domain-containing protein [Maridesulfovibrio ferrireducens]